jgi:hypothetical protein
MWRQALSFYHQALPIYHELGDRESTDGVQDNINSIYDYLGM